MRIRYSPRARKDLAGIHQYLIERSSTGATNVLAAIYAAIEFIKRNPRAAEATTISGVRAKAVRHYRFAIYYRLAGGDVIEIVHIRHTSRRPWSGEEC
jgi:plasmid stabilization system protein ParE